jgi:hypothetical protein
MPWGMLTQDTYLKFGKWSLVKGLKDTSSKHLLEFVKIVLLRKLKKPRIDILAFIVIPDECFVVFVEYGVHGWFDHLRDKGLTALRY